ncbi:MAG TPA: HEAT repeat domain-containing protein [Polyangiaceae bacterium]|nr:HEAT repeat domain-containing protein [Polyangiaceae bacterium]
MPSLSSSIVNQQVASVRDVEEALSRQSLYGGDLLTNLLELAVVSEERLGKVLAESHQLEPAPTGELPVAAEYVRRLVPADIAQRFALYPLEEREGTLTLAVAEPLPSEVEHDLSFSLGAKIVQKVALLVRVRQAIARDYGSAMDRRSLRVLARLSGRPDPSPSSLPSRPEGQAPERARPTASPAQPPAPALADAAQPAPAQPAPAQSAPPPSAPKKLPSKPPSIQPRVPRAPALPDFSSLAKPADSGRKRRLGPFTAAMAERGLAEAETRDDVLRAFFDFACQYFDYSALFAVQGDLAEGRDAAGAGAQRSRILAVGVPLDLPSAMSRVRDSASYELTRLSSGGLDGALAKDLERRPGRLVLFLPVQVRNRTVLILYGDHGERDVELSAVGEVISFAPLVANAFERLILRKRLREKGGEPAAVSMRARPREPAHPLPNAGERAATLASLIEGRFDSTRGIPSVRPSSRPPLPSPAAAPAPPVPAPATVKRSPPPPLPPSDPITPPTPRYTPAPTVAIPVISIGPASSRRPAANGQASPASAPSPPAASSPTSAPSPASAPATRRAEPEPPQPHAPDQPAAASPFARVERGTKPGVGSEPNTSEPPAPIAQTAADTIPEMPPAEFAPVSMRTGSLPRLQLVSDRPPPLPKAAYASPEDAPDIDVAPSSSELFDEGEYSPIDSQSGVPLAPVSRALSYSARPLPPRDTSQDVGLPTVIVDLASDTQALVDRLLEGDPTAGDKLVQIGDTAITVLASIFPGPITSELRRSSGDGPGKASDCGPVLRTLARMGTRPVPFVAVRTADGDPLVRAWATRLLGEMPSAESAQAVVRRLTDDDADVQRAALAAGHMLLHHPEAAEALQAKIAETVSDVTRPEESRHSLIEALAELRAPLVIPTLIRLLEDGSPDIVRSAHWALGVIARQDFGTKAALWEEWWLANSSRHRIEWLIDSLMHENQDLRRAAGDELKSLTKEYFGYYDDLPKKERQRAQDRYQEWWESKGKARFR